nr:heterodisulfide reductase-related iron-sulfur binding cluster [Bacillus pumilus]
MVGNKEKKCGDRGRRVGNEFLLEEVGRKKIEELEKKGVRKMVTIDAHG